MATHENLVPRLSASEMVGRAVFVTLPSSADNNNGRHIAMNDRQNPFVRVHFSEGVPDSSDGKDGREGRCGRSPLAVRSLLPRCCCLRSSSPKIALCSSWGVELSDSFNEEAFEGR